MSRGTRLKLAFRTLLVGVVFALAALDPDLLPRLLALGGGAVGAGIWLLLMAEMLVVALPGTSRHIYSGKCFERHHAPRETSPEGLRAYTARNHRGALRAALFWAAVLAAVGAARGTGLLSAQGVVLVSVFFYFADQFCVNVWCPFQAWIVRNRCCNECRIFNWGHFMIYSPLVFVPGFWTWSLVVVSLAILLQWELLLLRHPERFSPLSNGNLRCGSCGHDCRFREAGRAG